MKFRFYSLPVISESFHKHRLSQAQAQADYLLGMTSGQRMVCDLLIRKSDDPPQSTAEDLRCPCFNVQINGGTTHCLARNKEPESSSHQETLPWKEASIVEF